MAIAEFAPQLSLQLEDRALRDALAAAEVIEDKAHQVEAFLALLPQLSSELRETVLAAALDAAMAIGDEVNQGKAFIAFIDHLSPTEKNQQLVSVLNVVTAVGNDWVRARVLGALISYLSPEGKFEVLSSAIDAAMAVDESGVSRATALEPTIRHLSPGMKDKMLSHALACIWAERDAANDAWKHGVYIGSGPHIARALGGIAEYLSPKLKDEVFSDALAYAKTIPEAGACFEALIAMAPHLSPKHVTDALAITKRLYFFLASRAQALAALAQHFSPERKDEVFGDMLRHAVAGGNDGTRTLALQRLAPHVSAVQYETLVACLVEDAAKLHRSHALKAVTESVKNPAAFRDTREMEEVVRAINDTARWYP
jgi:hypothetical protein